LEEQSQLARWHLAEAIDVDRIMEEARVDVKEFMDKHCREAQIGEAC
jgi:hypothetical protein